MPYPLVVKKFPRILIFFVRHLDDWASFLKKKSDEKEQFLSGLRQKVKFLSGQVKWTLRAQFWVFFSKTLPVASFDVCAHLSSGDRHNFMLKLSASVQSLLKFAQIFSN